jgi:hypothetical protein
LLLFLLILAYSLSVILQLSMFLCSSDWKLAVSLILWGMITVSLYIIFCMVKIKNHAVGCYWVRNFYSAHIITK